MEEKSFDPVWEARYRENPNYRNHYPWSSVVSFVHKNKPEGRPHRSIKILEVGCGNGANLWFAAREGFSVSGIDASQTAIAHAQEWFAREGLVGDIRVGDFTELPFRDNFFDLVIDRSALTFSSPSNIVKAVKEVWRVLSIGGCFFFNPLSDRCSSFDGVPDQDGCYRKVRFGTILPGAQVTFFSIREIRDLFEAKWIIKKIIHNEQMDFHTPERITHAEWQVEVVKAVSANDS